MNGAVIDRLSDEDTKILKLGRGEIRGHACKVLVLEPTAGRPLPSAAAIRERVHSRLDSAPRFRRRVVHLPLDVANPVWIDDPGFDIANHVAAVPADHPLTRRELARLVARLMAEPLPPDRPLWHIAVLEPLPDDAMALIWRVHHCMADGSTFMRLAASTLWDSDEDGLDQPAARGRARPGAADGCVRPGRRRTGSVG